jgi:anti-sigma B factor antagonist
MDADPIIREQTIARYLARKLSASAREAFENHYLECQECYEELRVAELLIAGLESTGLQLTRDGEITIVRFTESTQLTATSPELEALYSTVRSDTKVLIDLSTVSRIDSAGLGMLMCCYTHAARNAGALKLLHPKIPVKRVLSMTGIDSIVPTFDDEGAALQSFRAPAASDDSTTIIP